MYDLRSLREQLPAIRDQLGSRGADVAWEEVEKLFVGGVVFMILGLLLVRAVVALSLIHI